MDTLGTILQEAVGVVALYVTQGTSVQYAQQIYGICMFHMYGACVEYAGNVKLYRVHV